LRYNHGFFFSRLMVNHFCDPRFLASYCVSVGLLQVSFRWVCILQSHSLVQSEWRGLEKKKKKKVKNEIWSLFC
jgi:hypothetical protein